MTTKITDIPKEQAITILHEAKTDTVEEFIKSLDYTITKLKGIKKELLKIK